MTTFLTTLLLSFVLTTLVQAQTAPLVREDQTVLIDSSMEHWLLQWQTPPRPICGPEDPDWFACPCSGFSFGEMGQLDLVRKRTNHPDEILHLTPFFEYGEVPSLQAEGVEAALQRWPVLGSDDESDHSAAFAKQIQQRPPTKAMHLGDYDHDGRATEFLLLIASGPCGHNGTILVGLSRKQPSLHAFTSIAHPERPLILDRHLWEGLLHSQGGFQSTQISCGGHGSEEETDVRLIISARGIDATRFTYDCRPDGGRGSLESTEAL